MTTNNITVGTEVTWSSSAAGTTKQKRGVVVAIVPADTSQTAVGALSLSVVLPAFSEFNWDYVPFALWGRKQESYLVAVEIKPTQKHRLYWPRTSALRKVQPDA